MARIAVCLHPGPFPLQPLRPGAAAGGAPGDTNFLAGVLRTCPGSATCPRVARFFVLEAHHVHASGNFPRGSVPAQCLLRTGSLHGLSVAVAAHAPGRRTVSRAPDGAAALWPGARYSGGQQTAESSFALGVEPDTCRAFPRHEAPPGKPLPVYRCAHRHSTGGKCPTVHGGEPRRRPIPLQGERSLTRFRRPEPGLEPPTGRIAGPASGSSGSHWASGGLHTCLGVLRGPR